MSQKIDMPFGIILVCSNATKEECLQRQIFGLPDIYLEMVKMIKPGMHLFLFNSTTRELTGGFTAASQGGYSLCSSAFRGDFPSQVKINIMVTSLPSITEDRYRDILDYFTEKRFKYVLDDNQVKQLFIVFDEEMKRKHITNEYFSSMSLLTQGRIDSTTSSLDTPDIYGQRIASMSHLASQWYPVVNRSVKYTLEASDGFGKHVMNMKLQNGKETGEMMDQQMHYSEINKSSMASEMEIIDLNTIDNILLKKENRTTLVIYPIPPIEKCQLTALIAILDISHLNQYQFIMLKCEYQRALYIDMHSAVEVIRIFIRFQNKTWKQISDGAVDILSRPKIGFWKEAQGIAQLVKKFELDSCWIPQDEPASLCHNLSENIPYIFLNTENEKYMPESIRNPGIDIDLFETSIGSERLSINCNEGLFFIEKGSILKFQYHELLKNIYDIKRENQNEFNSVINVETDVIQDFMDKKILECVKEDFQKLKQDIKEILKLRYSPEFYIDTQQYNFYCVIYRKICDYINQEYIIDEFDLF